MRAAAQHLSPEVSRHRPATVITTTLYDVVEAVQEEVSPGEEGLVTEVVANLFNSGRIQLADNAKGPDADVA